MGRRWKALNNALVLCIGALVGMALAEGILRVRGTIYLNGAPSADPQVKYTLRPGLRGYINGVYHSYNSHGIRDREYSDAPASGTTRILCVGDSVTFAQDIPLEATYPKLLEADLGARGRRVEVINAGVPGYDACTEEAFLRTVGLSYNPDVVVWQYCLNDLDESPDPSGSTMSGVVPLPAPMKRFLRAHVRLWGFLQVTSSELLREVRGERSPATDLELAKGSLARYTSPDTGPLDRAWGCIRSAHSQATGRSIVFLLVVVPYAPQIEGAPGFGDDAQQEVIRRCVASGIDCMDLLPRFKAANDGDLFERPDLVHLSARGQALIASSLAEALVERLASTTGSLRNAGTVRAGEPSHSAR